MKINSKNESCILLLLLFVKLEEDEDEDGEEITRKEREINK